ncbi:hypothetical protein LSAT2_011212, partial [Lamellibrachia satsuma]
TENTWMFEELVTVHVDQKPLLSGKASTHLGLSEIMHTVVIELDKYPELRQTTGTLPGTCSLKTDPTVPPVVHGPRCLPKAKSVTTRRTIRLWCASARLTDSTTAHALR